MSTGANGIRYAEYFLRAFHNVAAVLILVATIVLMAITMGSSSTQNSLYLTTTYLAAFYTDTPPLAWAPAGDPYHPQRVADTFYDCLYQAQVGFGGDTGCGGLGRDDYDNCINGITASPVYGQKRTIAAIREALVDYSGDGWNISALPSALTTPNTTQMAIDLSAPATRAALVVTLTTAPSLLTLRLANILNYAPTLQLGVVGCLSAASQAPGILHDIGPVYDSLWQCASTIVKTTSDSKEAYDQCIPLSAWPTLDVMQTPYSSTFLGCYNRHFVLVIGGWLLTSFAVYTFWLNMDGGSTSTGKPAHYLSRNGVVLASFCFAWNGLGALIMVLARSFGDQGAFKNFPMSVQTVLVTWVFSLLATFYFAREVWEHFAYGAAAAEGPADSARPEAASDIVFGQANASAATVSSSTATYGVSRVNGGRRYTNLSYFMRLPQPAAPDPALDDPYTPLLSLTWSDSWVFCDALLLLGVVGTSPDVVTADVVRVFLVTLYGNAIHTAFVRLLYEGYVNDAPGNDFRSRPYAEVKDSDGKYRQGIRVMAMVADFATLLFMIGGSYLLYGRYMGSSSILIVQYVSVCINVPYVLWLVYNLLVDAELVEPLLAEFSQVMFIVNLITRASFLLAIAVQANKDADANFGGDTSLQRLFMLANA